MSISLPVRSVSNYECSKCDFSLYVYRYDSLKPQVSVVAAVKLFPWTPDNMRTEQRRAAEQAR